MALPVGIQIYSVGDHASRDLVGTLKALKEMGYDCVELAGLYGLTAKDIFSFTTSETIFSLLWQCISPSV